MDVNNTLSLLSSNGVSGSFLVFPVESVWLPLLSCSPHIFFRLSNIVTVFLRTRYSNVTISGSPTGPSFTRRDQWPREWSLSCLGWFPTNMSMWLNCQTKSSLTDTGTGCYQFHKPQRDQERNQGRHGGVRPRDFICVDWSKETVDWSSDWEVFTQMVQSRRVNVYVNRLRYYVIMSRYRCSYYSC